MNIVFIGFASCGKSATAYAISRMLNMKFIDLDKEIEIRYFFKYNRELHYREIIKQHSPDVFFSIENTTLKELETLSDCVIAPGGGAPLQEENRDILRKLGTIVYIKAKPEILFKRMKAKGLPLFLREKPNLEYLTEIWNTRDKIYSSMTDLVIDNSEITILETAQQIVDLLKSRTII